MGRGRGPRAGALALTLVLGAAATSAALAAAGRIGQAAARGAALGSALATCGALGAMALSAWSFARPQRVFFAALAGGILGRLALYGGVLIYVALAAPERYDPTALVAALLFMYVLFLVIEVRELAGRVRTTKA